MSKPKITNDAPPSIYFKLPEFLFIQFNYHAINEIIFSQHTTRQILQQVPEHYPIAVFKVVPSKQLIVTEAGELEAYETMFR